MCGLGGGGGADPDTCLGRPLGNGVETSCKEIAGCRLSASKLGPHRAAMKLKKEPFTPARSSLPWLRKAMGNPDSVGELYPGLTLSESPEQLAGSIPTLLH